jgi:hypothetical protein
VSGDDGSYTQFEQRFAGGSHNVYDDNSPGLAGPTYTGVPNLKDVP